MWRCWRVGAKHVCGGGGLRALSVWGLGRVCAGGKVCKCGREGRCNCVKLSLLPSLQIDQTVQLQIQVIRVSLYSNRSMTNKNILFQFIYIVLNVTYLVIFIY